MAGTNYIDPTLGLEIPSVEELLIDLTLEQQATIDALLVTDADSIIGQLNGIFASHSREAFEAVQVAFDSIDPDNAEGVYLDHVCLISGTTRNPPTYTTLRVSVNVTAGVTVPIGTVFGVVDVTGNEPSPTVRCQTTVAYTNATAGTVVAVIPCRATVTGPVVFPIGTVHAIVTPVTGVTSANNATSYTIGAGEESDAALRTRRLAELRAEGSGTAAAIKADLLAYTADDGSHPILGAAVLENTTDLTNADGLPPHSFEAVVWDGAALSAPNLAIATIISGDRPPGISSQGSIGVTDPSLPTPERFSRAVQVAAFVEVTLKFKSGAYAGDAAVKAAIVAKFQNTKPAGSSTTGYMAWSDVVSAALSIQGVTRVELVRMQQTGGGLLSNTDLQPAVRAVLVLDPANVSVLSSVEVS